MSTKRAPASGEQAAIRGYFTQYEFSASTLLRLMQVNHLDAISVCDHAAGRGKGVNPSYTQRPLVHEGG